MVRCEYYNPQLNNGLKYTIYIDRHTRDCHIEFEFIHPFEDGNGRVGRIIYNVHRLNIGLPIHVIHEGDEQMDYYGWFRNT